MLCRVVNKLHTMCFRQSTKMPDFLQRLLNSNNTYSKLMSKSVQQYTSSTAACYQYSINEALMSVDERTVCLKFNLNLNETDDADCGKNRLLILRNSWPILPGWSPRSAGCSSCSGLSGPSSIISPLTRSSPIPSAPELDPPLASSLLLLFRWLDSTCISHICSCRMSSL